MISQGLTRPVRKNFAKHCESRTAEVAAKPEITRHSPQLFSAKGQIRVLLCHSQREEHHSSESWFFSLIFHLYQKVCSVPPLRLVSVICLRHFFSEPCFQGNVDFLTLPGTCLAPALQELCPPRRPTFLSFLLTNLHKPNKKGQTSQSPFT